MTNVETARRGQGATRILFLALFFTILFLAYTIIATITTGFAAADGVQATASEPRAVIVGLRAGHAPQGPAPERRAQAPAADIQETRRLFTRRGVYHDPLLGVSLSLEHVYRLQLAPGVSLEETIARLQQRPDVAFVEPDYVAEQIAMPDDPRFDEQWGLTQINAPDAWDVQTGGGLVAIVDAGVDIDHPDLSAQLWTNPGEIPGNGLDDDSNGYIDDVHGWNFYGNDDDLSDSTGHGTQVAGLVGATGNNGSGITGVCWDCQLMVLKVIQPGGTANYSDIAAAIDYAIIKGAGVVNLSLGGYSDSVALRAAVGSAVDGAVLVGGAGNDDGDQPFYPAAYEGVLGVAGADDADARVSSSNYGAWVDLSAPGSAVLTTFDGGGYGETAGTSLAAPFASGAAALLQSANNWSPALVRAHLLQTAAPIDAANPGYEGLLGSGRLDAGAALTTAPQPDLVAEIITVDGQDGGRPEPGTTVDLDVTLGNHWAPIGPLQGTLSSSDPYVTVEESATTFEALDTYATAQSDTPLHITIAGDAPYGHELALQLALSEGGSQIAIVPFTIPVASQTIEVSGIISSDTTWHGDRVYRLTGNTVVADGATLTLEAGVQVFVEPDYVLRVQGVLSGTGAIDAPLVFTSAEETPTAQDWQGIEVTDTGRLALDGCEVAYAETGIQVSTLYYTETHTIDNCTIHNNITGVEVHDGVVTISSSRLLYNRGLAATGLGNGTIQDSEVAYNGGGVSEFTYVLRNSIHHNDSAFIGWREGTGIASSRYVYSNTIVMNSVGIVGSSYSDVQYNNIDRNRFYNFWLNGNDNAALPNNWWGTTDLNAINETIYDFGEDSNRGILDVQPILTASFGVAPTYFHDVDVAPDTTVGLQEVTLDMSFSAPMDESVAPDVLLRLEQWIDENDVPGWSATHVEDIAMTPDGALWLATNDGVVRYDGSQGTIHLQDRWVNALTVDTNGYLWAAATGAAQLWRFDGNTWVEYFESGEFSLPAPDTITADPGGGIWILSCGNATHFDGVTVTAYLLYDLIDNFEGCVWQADTSPDGTLWFSTEGAVIRFDGSQWTLYEPLEELEGDTWWINSVAAVDANEVWVNAEEILLHLDDDGWTVVHTPARGFYYSPYSSNIEIAANGDVLVARENRLLHYDGSNWTTIKTLSTDESATETNVRRIHDTGNGSIWLGTNHGALQLHETPIESGQWLDNNTYQARHRITSLMPRGDYEVEVSGAFDAQGNETPPVSRPAFTVDYAGEVVDTTPPPAPIVIANGVDGDPSAVTAQWQTNDPDSTIVAYRYAIGSTAAGRQIVDWTTTTDTGTTRTGLGLVEGQTYWFSVQAQNSGGLWSETTTRSFVAGQGSFNVFLPAIQGD